MNFKEGKWAEQIISHQRKDGTWGPYFHTLSLPVKDKPLTTEQALRRLWILGFDVNDAPIRKTVEYMKACLRGERKMDDMWEKRHDWPLFTKFMLSAWVKLFEPENELALEFAYRWADIVEKAFQSGAYNHDDYVNAYIGQFGDTHLTTEDIDKFYCVSLLQGILTPKTEDLWLDLVLSRPEGICYIYNKPLNQPPLIFASIESSRYLAALEVLAGYRTAKEKLGFAMRWLSDNQDANGQWDFGAAAYDNVYFPLSDSWRKAEDRKADCTERVNAFLRKLNA